MTEPVSVLPISRRFIDTLVLILVPICLVACAWFKVDQTALISLVVVVLALVPFFLQFEQKKPKPRDIMPIIVLAALAVAGRIIFAPLPNIKPVSAIVIVAGICFGRQSGFMTGALAALVSNLFFGQGPWTPWQMYGWGCMGYMAGMLEDHGIFKHQVLVYVYGFIAPVMYGLILDTYFFIGFVGEANLSAAVLVYSAGLTASLMHAIATVVFLVPLYMPWRKKLHRLKRKYGIE